MIKVLDNGTEYSLCENVLLTDLVYKCDECGFYHVSPKADIKEVLKFEE